MHRKSIYKALLFFTLFSVSELLLAQKFQTYWEQLIDINKYWEKEENYCFYPQSFLLQEAKNVDRETLIQEHLALVEIALKNRYLIKISEEKNEKRFNLLNDLNTYWNKAIFPKNNFSETTTPIFIDENRNACAVAHLIQQTDNENLSLKISQTANQNFIAEMPFETELNEWATDNGLTLEELKWIQPSYHPDWGNVNNEKPLNIKINLDKPNCGESNGRISFDLYKNPVYQDEWSNSHLHPNDFIFKWTSVLDNESTWSKEHSLENLKAGVYMLEIYKDYFIDFAIPAYIKGARYRPQPYFRKFIALSNESDIELYSTIKNSTCDYSKDGSISVYTEKNDELDFTWYNRTWKYVIGKDCEIDNLIGEPYYTEHFHRNSVHPLAGKYNLKIVDNNGCITFKKYKINIENQELATIKPNISRPNKGKSNGEVAIYSPNPFEAEVAVEWLNDGSKETYRNDLKAGVYEIWLHYKGCSEVMYLNLRDRNAR